MPEQNVGKVIEIRGVVIDVAFTDRLPEINTALEIAMPSEDGSEGVLVAEVQQHLGDDRVRAVAMDSTDGIPRGVDVIDTGAPTITLWLSRGNAPQLGRPQDRSPYGASLIRRLRHAHSR